MIVKFPAARTRRITSRRPRRSKNGTPEERAARLEATLVRHEQARKPRGSKNGSPEERSAKLPPPAAVIEFTRRRIERLQRMARSIPKPQNAFEAVLSELREPELLAVGKYIDAALEQLDTAT
jgi:hypothetical protein